MSCRSTCCRFYYRSLSCIDSIINKSQGDSYERKPENDRETQQLLADELTAINQYIVHSEMCNNWGYEKLHNADEKRAIDEMKHAEKLIARILFLEGLPVVSDLKKITIGSDVAAQHNNDHFSEEGAVASYNDGIRLAVEIGDNGTRETLESILKMRKHTLTGLRHKLTR